MRTLLVSALLAVSTAATAAELKIAVQRSGFAGPIEVAIATRVEGRLPEWSHTKKLPAGKSSVTFDGLDEGLYTVLLSGPQPLQRLSAKANVGSGENALRMTLPKTSSTGVRVTRAGKPFPDADVELTQDELRWSTNVDLNEEGRFEGELWQPGLYTASVRHNSGPHVVDVMLAPQPVTIDVPDRDVRGRVLDEAGKPIAGAGVALKSQNADGTITVRTTSGPDGSFAFIGVREGAQTLWARASSFLNSDDVTFEFSNASAHENVDFKMTRGAMQQVRVVDERGQPIANASLATSCDGHMKSTTVSNAEGRAEVAVPQSGPCAIFALPKEGSLAMERVERNGPIVLRVPNGSSSLQLTLESDGGTAFEGMWLLMRIDGMLVPPPIARQLSSRGFKLATNAAGSISLEHIPPGTYEFWPYRTDAEGQRLYELAGDFAAPISVNVLTGENNAKVRLKARH